MKKIISILLALGLVLGLSVMATPAVTAQCPGTSVTNCAVTVDVPVECQSSCYNITFTLTSALSVGDKISLTFPSASLIAGVTASDVTINGTAPLSVNITSGGEMHIAVNSSYSAGANLRVRVCNVVNPSPVGTYQISVKTVWDQCPCAASFAILAGGDINPKTAIWCPCHNLSFPVTWGASTSILTVDGLAFNWTKSGDTGTLNIACAALMALGLNACGVLTLQVDFDPGCNRTLTITVADAANVTLVTGWNLISLPIIPLSTDIEDVLADVLANVSSVWYYDGCDAEWSVYKNGTGFDSLETMEAGKSYWVCMTAPGILQLCGYELPCPPGGPPCYCYCDCWNMVGFHSTVSRNLSDYLATLNPAGALFQALTWTGGTGWVSVNSSTMMNVGQGYWMAFVTDVCFAPPV